MAGLKLKSRRRCVGNRFIGDVEFESGRDFAGRACERGVKSWRSSPAVVSWPADILHQPGLTFYLPATTRAIHRRREERSWNPPRRPPCSLLRRAQSRRERQRLERAGAELVTGVARDAATSPANRGAGVLACEFGARLAARSRSETLA